MAFQGFEPIDLTPLRMLSLYSNIGNGSQQSQSGPVNRPPPSPYESEFGEGPTPYYPSSPSQDSEYQSEFAEGPTDYSNYVNPIKPPSVPTYGGMDRPDPLKPMTTQELMELAQKLYTPQTGASTKFNELLSNFPQQRSPGWLRGIGAIAAAAGPGGYETSQKIMDAPYNRDIAAWKEQVGPAYNAVQGENYANAQERQLATGLATNVVNQNRYDQQNRIAEFKAQSGRIRDAAYAYKQRLPEPENWVQERDSPTIVWVNRTTQERRDTGIPSRLMSDEDKLMLQYNMDWNMMLGRGANDRLTNASPRFDTTPSNVNPQDIQRIADQELQEVMRANPSYGQFRNLVKWDGTQWILGRGPQAAGDWNPFNTDVIDPQEQTAWDQLRQELKARVARRIQQSPQQGQPVIPSGPPTTPPPVSRGGFPTGPTPPPAGPFGNPIPPPGSANPGNYPPVSPTMGGNGQLTLPRGTPVGGAFNSSMPNIAPPQSPNAQPTPGSQGQPGPVSKAQQDAGLADGTYALAIKGKEILVILNTPSSVSQFQQQGYDVRGAR